MRLLYPYFCIGQIHSSQANVSPVSLDIHFILRNPTAYHRVHNSQPLAYRKAHAFTSHRPSFRVM